MKTKIIYILAENFARKKVAKTLLKNVIRKASKNRIDEDLRVKRTLFASRSSESPCADAIAVDAFSMAVAIRNFTLVVLELTLQTFPAWKKMM